VIPVKFRAPGGTVCELVPGGRYKQPKKVQAKARAKAGVKVKAKKASPKRVKAKKAGKAKGKKK
jgi:hypothetical protein